MMWGKKKKIIVVVGAALIAIVVIISMIFIFPLSKENEPDIITQSTLEKIIKVSELSTFEAVYNGISKVMNKTKPEEIDYYVSYEAKVKAGIDFEQVEIVVNKEDKKVSVTMPEIKINDIIVDIASLDYIWVNDKANTETVTEEAYKKCIEDVKKESSAEDAIYDLAEQNAKSIIEALIKPFINQVDPEFKLVIE